jgi:hypothetical protein
LFKVQGSRFKVQGSRFKDKGFMLLLCVLLARKPKDRINRIDRMFEHFTGEWF